MLIICIFYLIRLSLYSQENKSFHIFWYQTSTSFYEIKMRYFIKCMTNYSSILTKIFNIYRLPTYFRSRADRLKYRSVFVNANNLHSLRNDTSWFLCNFNIVQLPLLDNRYCDKNDYRSSIIYSEAINDISSVKNLFYSYSHARYLHKIPSRIILSMQFFFTHKF